MKKPGITSIEKKSIVFSRLSNQGLAGNRFKSAIDLALHMVAIQAQDLAMAKWGFGVRVAGLTEKKLNDALDSGILIRSHLLRPTWHIAAAEDIHWLTELSKAHIRTSMRTRDKQLGLTARIFSQCNTAIGKSLEGNRHLTRDELFEEIINSGVKIVKEQASHIYVHAETDGLICSGRQKGGKTTFALLSERVTENKTNYNREEAVSELAFRYFTSRGPATAEDFAWWSGLAVRDVKTAVENNRNRLLSLKTDDSTYWFSEATGKVKPLKRILLLPAFDEYLICYRDRSAMLPGNVNKKAVSDNGIFYPIIVESGQVKGTWSRSLKKDSFLVTLKFFGNGPADPRKLLKKPVNDFSLFTGKHVEIFSNDQSSGF